MESLTNSIRSLIPLEESLQDQFEPTHDIDWVSFLGIIKNHPKQIQESILIVPEFHPILLTLSPPRVILVNQKTPPHYQELFMEGIKKNIRIIFNENDWEKILIASLNWIRGIKSKEELYRLRLQVTNSKTTSPPHDSQFSKSHENLKSTSAPDLKESNKLKKFLLQVSRAKSISSLESLSKRWFPNYLPPLAQTIVQSRKERLQILEESKLHQKIIHEILSRLPMELLLVDQNYLVWQYNRKAKTQLPCYKLLFSRSEPCKGCKLGTSFRLKTPPRQIHSTSIKQGNQIFFFNIYENLEALNQVEYQILQEETFQQLAVLSASLAHELASPIGVILTFLQLIQKDLSQRENIKSPLYPNLKDDLKIMIEKSRFLKDLTQQWLLFARLKWDELEKNANLLWEASWNLGQLEVLGIPPLPHEMFQSQIASELTKDELMLTSLLIEKLVFWIQTLRKKEPQFRTISSGQIQLLVDSQEIRLILKNWSPPLPLELFLQYAQNWIPSHSKVLRPSYQSIEIKWSRWIFRQNFDAAYI